MQSTLLKWAIYALSIYAICLVNLLLIYKIYIKIRSRYNILVNCWFCNENTRVAFVERNSWYCPKCTQYNGFTKDGDYNRDILSNSTKEKNCSGHYTNAYYTDISTSNATAASLNNGLCDQCNEAQRLKVDKLRQFEPKYESRYERELKAYQEELEKQFRLCSTCENHVVQVLREKKKMVLGSKFLNFIMKGAALLKQPHFNELARAHKLRKLARYSRLMTWLTLINILCLLSSQPVATSEQFQSYLGEPCGSALFFLYSHVLTVLRVIGIYIGSFLDNEQTFKVLLYIRTLGKLVLYSVGMMQQQVQAATFASCYTTVYPYIMLIVNIIHNIVDGFKVTRFTMLLLLWGVYAHSSPLLFDAINGTIFVLLGSIVSLLLLVTHHTSGLVDMDKHDVSVCSFHKLCAEDCLSDDETISMLSQQLNCSNRSSCSDSSPSNMKTRTMRRAPSALSLHSLNLSSRHHQHKANGEHLMHSRPSIETFSSKMSPNMNLSMGAVRSEGWHSNYGGPPISPTLSSNGFGLGHSNHWRSNYNGYDGEQTGRTYFSLYGNGMLQQRRPAPSRSRNNLLMPSRLSNANLNLEPQQPVLQQQKQRNMVPNGDVNAWVATTLTNSYNNLALAQSEDKMSHASSYSSGFESLAISKSQFNNSYYAPIREPAEQSAARLTPDSTPLYKPGDLLYRWRHSKEKVVE